MASCFAVKSSCNSPLFFAIVFLAGGARIGSYFESRLSYPKGNHLYQSNPRSGHRSRGRAQAHPTQAAEHRAKFEALPEPWGDPPYSISFESAFPEIAQACLSTGTLSIQCIGNTGGEEVEAYRSSVVRSLVSDSQLADGVKPNFLLHLGNAAYPSGTSQAYCEQFIEPFSSYSLPIFGIPGDRDGEIGSDDLDSLRGWIECFSSLVGVPSVGRVLPNVYYSISAPFATIVSLYTNVPEGGSVDIAQQLWLTRELSTAPLHKALILAMHHPVYSFDHRYRGSTVMGELLQRSINDSRRVPNLVLSSHAHNYQLIEKDVVPNSFVPLKLPFVVIGNSGNALLDEIQPGVAEGYMDAEAGAKLVFADSRNHGYLTLRIDSKVIAGSYAVANPGEAPRSGVHTFTYSAGARSLPERFMLNLGA
jgi:hypothetical protein